MINETMTPPEAIFDLQGAYAYMLAHLPDYFIAIGVFILLTLALKVFKYIIVVRMRAISKKTRNQIDDLIVEIVDHIHWPFYVLLSLYIGTRFARLPAVIDTAIYYIFLVALTYYVIRGIQRALDFGINILVERRREEDPDADTTLIHMMGRILDGVLWGVAALLIIQNLGYDISALIAGLGIGGLAVAIALQNVLSDIFASFSIYFDKPFKVGDYIAVGQDAGTVKR